MSRANNRVEPTAEKFIFEESMTSEEKGTLRNLIGLGDAAVLNTTSDGKTNPTLILKTDANGAVTVADVATDTLSFTTTNGAPQNLGELAWFQDEETLSLLLKGGTLLELGEETIYHVENNTGTTIAKGAPVMYAGTAGNSGKLRVKTWDGTDSKAFMGIATMAITGAEGTGYVTHFGKLRGIQTNGANYGQTWVSGNIIYAVTGSANLTNVAPSAGGYVVVAVIISASANNGTMFVRPTQVPSLAELGAAAATHASTHATGGSDPITPAAIGAAPKFPPGVFEDNYAASLSGAVGKNEIYRQPSGVLAWLGLTADAAAYQDAHGISDARAVSLSAFFEGLADIGVAENFQDGGCFRRDTQPAAGAVARSLLGLGDLTLFAEPTKMRGGLYFDSTLSQYAYGSIPQTTGAREVVIFHSGLIANASTTQDVIARLRNGTTNTSLALASNGTTFGQATSFAGGSVRVTPGNPGWARNTTPFIASAVRDDGLAGVSSFSQYRWPTQAATFSRTSTQGEASHSLNNLILCADSNGTLTTFFRYIERIIPGWMLFDRILTDQETTDLNALISATLFPRWRMIWEGDSISNFIQQRASDKASFAGGNIHWINLALSGDATNNGIDQLGTSTGLNDTNLDGALPTVVEISYGQNDLGNYPARTVAEIHANLRTLWAYAKTRGAKVAARTVMQASSVYPTAREADRLILNDLIRADQGSHYDILVDLDQWCLDFTEIRPYYNDPQLFAPGDKVHPTLEAGKGANLMAAWISEVLDEAGAIP